MNNIDPAGGVSDVITAAHSLALAWAIKRAEYDTAQDIAQEVAIAVWQERVRDPAIFERREELERFVSVAARNGFVDQMRRAERRARHEGESEGEWREHSRQWMCPEDETNYSELSTAFDAALRRTPLRCRMAFMLVHCDDLSYASAAKRLRVSTRALESRLRRTRVELRAELADFRMGDAA